MVKDPFDDPVREAFTRFRERFPIMDEVMSFDPATNATLKRMERMLVVVDCAMQDEGLDHGARRRVVSAALYGELDEETAVELLRDSARVGLLSCRLSSRLTERPPGCTAVPRNALIRAALRRWVRSVPRVVPLTGVGRDSETLKLRVVAVLKARVREYADRHGISLNAAAILLDKGLRADEPERR